jgi:hypothetical protein
VDVDGFRGEDGVKMLLDAINSQIDLKEETRVGEHYKTERSTELGQCGWLK